jgi:hypothetical protein
VKTSNESEEAIDDLRSSFADTTRSSTRGERQALLASGLVLSDLATQGWQVRVRRGRVEVGPPVPLSDDRAAEKARIRQQELVKRDAQLRNASVQKFVRSMERPRILDGRFTSIFSLLRDGRELAEDLRRVRKQCSDNCASVLASIIAPSVPKYGPYP